MIIASSLLAYGIVFSFNNVAVPFFMERDYFRYPGPECHLAHLNQCQSNTNVPVNCPDVSGYAPPLPVNVSAVDVDCELDEYNSVGSCTYIYCDRKNKANDQATLTMSIPNIVATAAAPFVGSFLKRFGNRAKCMLLCPVVLLLTHVLLFSIRGFAEVLLVLQGIAFCIFTGAISPAISLSVAPKYNGLAFGLLSCSINFAFTFFPLAVTGMYEIHDSKYEQINILYIPVICVFLFSTVYLNYLDEKEGRVLNNP